MRCKISVTKKSSTPLHYDYQYGISSMLYAKLADSDWQMAKDLHSHKGFKYYTFSHLVLENDFDCRKGLDFEDAHFILSSPNSEFISGFTEGLFISPEFHLKNKGEKIDFQIRDIEVLKTPEISTSCKFRTLSPIYTKTLRPSEGGFKEYDLYPKDAKFYENIHKNLVSKYEEYYQNKVDADYFEIRGVDDFKAKKIKIGNSYRRCSLCTMEVTGNPGLLKFAYDAGLGEKNAMGFGCIDKVG